MLVSTHCCIPYYRPHSITAFVTYLHSSVCARNTIEGAKQGHLEWLTPNHLQVQEILTLAVSVPCQHHCGVYSVSALLAHHHHWKTMKLLKFQTSQEDSITPMVPSHHIGHHYKKVTSYCVYDLVSDNQQSVHKLFSSYNLLDSFASVWEAYCCSTYFQGYS